MKRCPTCQELRKPNDLASIANCFSAALPTSCGVLQGSVLGPLFVTLCTTPLSSVIQTHNLDHHLYADDTHIYLSLATTDTNCSVNQLKLTANKTEFLIIGTQKQRCKLECFLSDTYAKPEFQTVRLSTEFRSHL